METSKVSYLLVKAVTWITGCTWKAARATTRLVEERRASTRNTGSGCEFSAMFMDPVSWGIQYHDVI